MANTAGTLFDLNGYAQTVSSLSGGGTTGGNVALGAGTLTVGNAASTTYAGVISGDSGSLVKQGTGTLTVTGTNTYGGPTVITAGNLAIGSDANLGAAPASPTAGNIVINGGTLQTTASFTLNANRGIALGPASGAGTGTINVASGTLTYGGIAADTPGGVGNLTKAGAGQLTLNGPNTYTGTTSIAAGTLALGNAVRVGRRRQHHVCRRNPPVQLRRHRRLRRPNQE